MTNIRTLLKNASKVLFSDDENFNKDITGVKNLKDVQNAMGIRVKVKRVGAFGNMVLYQNSYYNFTLTIIN